MEKGRLQAADPSPGLLGKHDRRKNSCRGLWQARQGVQRAWYGRQRRHRPAAAVGRQARLLARQTPPGVLIKDLERWRRRRARRAGRPPATAKQAQQRLRVALATAAGQGRRGLAAVWPVGSKRVVW